MTFSGSLPAGLYNAVRRDPDRIALTAAGEHTAFKDLWIRSKTGFMEYVYEPFYRDLLKSIYNNQLQDLIKKSRIFVGKGRILMGTIDETGLLKSDQVFIQCSIDTTTIDSFEFYNEIEKSKRTGYFIVKSKVIVAKNPCMHPGDVRILNAVYLPQLEHMVDCIVFPRQGKRPITNMCSGSDLDGEVIFYFLYCFILYFLNIR